MGSLQAADLTPATVPPSLIRRDRLGRSFDRRENLLASRLVELVTVEAQEQAFADRSCCGLRILIPQRGFDKGPRRITHGASHDEPCLACPPQEHSLSDLVLCTIPQISYHNIGKNIIASMGSAQTAQR